MTDEEFVKWLMTTMTLNACLIIHFCFPDPCWMLRGSEVLLIIIGALVIVFLLGWWRYYTDKTWGLKNGLKPQYPDVWEKEED